jgi:uncharacterized lipoprotein YmbA
VRKPRTGLSCFISILFVLLAGCVDLGKGTQEATRFYRLESSSPGSETASRGPRVGALPSDLALQVGPVRIASYLKRAQIVTRNGPYEYRLATFEQWAEPLDNNIARVLAKNLESDLGTDRVGIFPWKYQGKPDLRVIVDVQRFDGLLGKDVLLAAKWSIEVPGSQKELMVQEASFREKPDGPGYSELVAAMSRSLAALSREIAHNIETVAAEKKIKGEEP